MGKHTHRHKHGDTGAAAPKQAWSELPSALGIGAVHRVELKAMLDNKLSDVASVLGLSLGSARRREVYYWDDPSCTLRDQGVIIRGRLMAWGRADLVTKLRTSGPRRLPKAVARLPHLTVELDALPHNTHWCASLKHTTAQHTVHSAPDQRNAWLELLSREQRIFLAHSTGQDALTQDFLINTLEPRGPASVVKLVGRLPRLSKIAVESWHFPDGQHLVELSIKCRPKQTERTITALRTLFATQRMRPCRSQRTKTDISLHHVRWTTQEPAHPPGR